MSKTDKRSFFLAAMKAEEFRRRAWVISAFAQTNEGADAWKADPYPYRIVQTPTGHFYVDPENENQLTKIEDAKAGEAPFKFKDRIQLKKGEIPNVFEDIDTIYGNLLVNYTVSIYPFGHKIPFILGRFSPKDMEARIIVRLRDTPKESISSGDNLVQVSDTPNTKGSAATARDDKFIYVDEYLKYVDAAFSMVGYSQICVPAVTEKSLVGAPGVKELRDKLLEENKDRLHDPAVIAKIDAELVAYDRAYLKGDPSEGFLISDKSFAIVRKRRFSMHGAETGLSESVNVTLIKNSLSEGWDVNAFPAMNDSLRAGSFNRGAQTVLGGESVKWLLRASSNLRVAEKDCGSKLGNDFTVDGENYKWLIGFNIVTKNPPLNTLYKDTTNISDAETAKQYIGKTVTVRSPMYCKSNNTDFCECCVGNVLSENPNALSSAISAYGSKFLYMFMSAAHSKALTLARFDWKKDIF